MIPFAVFAWTCTHPACPRRGRAAGASRGAHIVIPPRHGRASAERDQSQPLRRKPRWIRKQATAITPSTSGYPYVQRSSGMWSKFMP